MDTLPHSLVKVFRVQAQQQEKAKLSTLLSPNAKSTNDLIPHVAIPETKMMNPSLKEDSRNVVKQDER